MEIRGIVFDIKRYAVHDGPGIRTTVFFKGCPLRCLWCHNPESQKLAPEAAENITRKKFLNYSDSSNENFIGTEFTVSELMKEIEKDVIFYDESGGGITISGGEPLMQPEFLYGLLKECKAKDIHTAVDTSGYASQGIFNKIYDYVDLFLFDLKIIDEKEHLKYVGVPNKLILSNLINLNQKGKKVRIRVPLIPGITDSEKNLNQIIETISNLKTISNIDLLPYNEMSEGKYSRFKKQFELKNLKTQPEVTINRIKKSFEPLGCEISIRG